MNLKNLRLRTLLLLLSVGGIILTSALLLGVLLLFQKQSIENSLLRTNIAYARKLADTTDRYFTMAQQELAWSAERIKDLHQRGILHEESERLRLQSGLFNSVVVVNRDAEIVDTSPENGYHVGTRLDTPVSRQALTSRRPFISAPFVSVTGHYVVFLSQPLFSATGQYIGYVGGTIYLKSHSILSDILSQHFYGRDLDVSVVSNEGLIIFNHNPALVGQKMAFSSELRRQLLATDCGRFSSYTGGEKILTGYAGLHKTEWNIFISGSSAMVRDILRQSVEKTLLVIVAIIALTAGTVGVLAARIASPLEKLADMVRSPEESPLPAAPDTWYYEVSRLKAAVQEHHAAVAGRVAALHDEAMTDPLTGLLNRRGFSHLMARYSEKRMLSVIAIDIDHFKKINDWYGHDAGDAVLVSMAALLRENCRSGEGICRFGGEEFIVLLGDVRPAEAAALAEQIRVAVHRTLFPFAGTVTISAGVATGSDAPGERKTLLRTADEALYEAKAAGRNTVVVAEAGRFRRYS